MVEMKTQEKLKTIGKGMITISIALAALILLVGTAAAMSAPREEWNVTLSNYNYASSIQQTTDGGYITAAWMSLVKTDSFGRELWNKTLTFGTYGSRSVQQTSDGGYIVAGSNSSLLNIMIAKFDSSGNEEWQKSYTSYNVSLAYSVNQTSDGGYFISGQESANLSGAPDVLVIKTDQYGNEQWNKTFGGPRWDRAFDGEQTSDGGFAIAGLTAVNAPNKLNAWLIKLDPLGNMLWNQNYGGIDYEEFDSLQQTPDGGYILAGLTQNSTTHDGDGLLVKTDSLGNQQFYKTFGGNQTEWFRSVRITSDGGYIIAGETASFGAGGIDAWLVKTDQFGNLTWDKTFGGNNTDWAVDAEQTSDGGYIVAGATESFGTGAWLIKTVNETANLLANLQISKTGPANADNGTQIIYTLSYDNTGDTAASAVTLVDTVPESVEFVSASDGGVYDSATRNVTWTIDNVPAYPDGYGTRMVTVQIPVSVYAGTIIQNNATISTTDSESNYNDNSANATTTVTEKMLANLQVSQYAPQSILNGTSMTYSLYFFNSGSVASGVMLVDTLPAGAEFVAASDGGTFDPATGNVSWNIDTVRAYPNGYGSRTVTIAIPASVPIDTVLENIATISTIDPEPDYNDNSANITTKVIEPNLPQNVSMEPIVDISGGTPLVFWQNPVTFSFSSSCATSVGIDIHLDDGGSNITGAMAESAPGTWTYTTTFFPRHGSATVTYTIAGCEQTNVSFNIYIDPAGYIYDSATSERIAGASVWLEQPDGAGGWKNVSTGQDPAVMQPDTNPLITNADGQYQWDVLPGVYRVHVEADGYYPADSIAVNIPPPVTDLHVGLTRIPVVDNTPPTINLATPVDGASYILNQSILANWQATDNSGIKTATATAANGTPIDTRTVGQKTFTVNATDNAGNTATKTVAYNVVYNFSLQQPINADNSSIFKLGSTVPAKFNLTDANGNSVTNAVAKIYIAKISDGITGTEIEAISTSSANTGNQFRYDATLGQYIFNLGTRSLTKGTYQIRIELDDGTSKYVSIGLK